MASRSCHSSMPSCWLTYGVGFLSLSHRMALALRTDDRTWFTHYSPCSTIQSVNAPSRTSRSPNKIVARNGKNLIILIVAHIHLRHPNRNLSHLIACGASHRLVSRTLKNSVGSRHSAISAFAAPVASRFRADILTTTQPFDKRLRPDHG